MTLGEASEIWGSAETAGSAAGGQFSMSPDSGRLQLRSALRKASRRHRILSVAATAAFGARRNRRHVGICGVAPATYPEIAEYLTGLGIESMSVNPRAWRRP